MRKIDFNKGKSVFSLKRPDLNDLEFQKPMKNEPRYSVYARHNAGKRFAIYMLGMNLIQKLKGFQDSMFFEDPCNPVDAVVSHVFSWSFKDYQQRRRESNLLELLVLARMPADCLEQKKAFHDLKQVQKLIIAILEPYLNENTLEHAMEELQDKLEYDRVSESLNEELKAQWRTFYKVSRSSLAAISFRFTIPKEMLKGRQLYQSVYFPIEQRYARKYGRMLTESAEIKYGKENASIEHQLEYYEQKIQDEQKVHQHVMMAYEFQTTDYYSNVARMDAMYDIDFELSMNQNLRFKKLIENLENNRASMEQLMIEHREALAAKRIEEEEKRLRHIEYLDRMEKEEAERKRLKKQKSKERKLAKKKALKEHLKSISLRSLVKSASAKSVAEKSDDVKSETKKIPAGRKSPDKKSNLTEREEEEKSTTINYQAPYLDLRSSQESNLAARKSQESKLSMTKLQTKKSQETISSVRKSQEIKSTTARTSLNVRKSQESKLSTRMSQTKKSQETISSVRKSQEIKLDVAQSPTDTTDVRKSQEDKVQGEIAPPEKITTKKRKSSSARKSVTGKTSTSSKKSGRKLQTQKSKDRKSDTKESKERKSDTRESKGRKSETRESKGRKSDTRESKEKSQNEENKPIGQDNQIQENHVIENQNLNETNLENQHLEVKDVENQN